VDPLSVKVKEILNFSFPEFPGNEITVKVRPEGRHTSSYCLSILSSQSFWKTRTSV